ncbi:MAG: MbnP family protein [Saprospiraceae bacterium]|nr:MbnP family protein [Saprospiraceae bacterium]
MKHLNYIFFSLLIIGLVSCKDDPSATEGTVTLHFKAVYDEETLQMFNTRPFENGEFLEFTQLVMIISDLELLRQGSAELLDEVEIVNLSFDNTTAAEAGYILTISGVPTGTYDGLRFGVGVPADVNAKKPADFPSSNPLSNTAHYWTPWSSYIFMKTEGRLDTLGNGNLDLGFALHTGSDALYSILEANIPLTVEEGMETNLDIVIDYKKVLQGVDIKANPQNHSPDDISTITVIVNNLAIAFSLVL